MNKITIILGVLIILLQGCDDFLDVNENPNYPKEVEDYLILPSAQASVANVFSADYGLLGSFWSQHWVQNNTSSQYKTYETYTFSNNSGVVDRSYRELFIGGLADNEILHVKAKEEENWGLYLMTSTLKAFTFQYLVDLYGNVPYTEAFQGDIGNFNPVIDGGESIYTNIYELLNEALSKDISDFVKSNYSGYDLFFKADMTSWTRFANTLKLRILLRQYAAKESWAATEIASLLNSGEFLTSNVALTNFEDADSKSNPLYESDQRKLNTSNNIRANATFTSYLKSNSDPRLSVLFDSVGDDLVGMITGSYEVPSTRFEAPNSVSKPHLTPTMPVYLMTVAETELLLAEAYLRAGNTAEAKAHYEAGVRSSFSRMGVSSGDLLDDGKAYAFPSSGFDAQLEAIIMQKWVDAADGQRGIESFIDWVRTGYPKVSEVSSSIPEGLESDLPAGYEPGTLIYSKKGTTGGKFPVRLPYAASEMNYNSNAAEYKSLTSAEVMQSKVWWNK